MILRIRTRMISREPLSLCASLLTTLPLHLPPPAIPLRMKRGILCTRKPLSVITLRIYKSVCPGTVAVPVHNSFDVLCDSCGMSHDGDLPAAATHVEGLHSSTEYSSPFSGSTYEVGTSAAEYDPEVDFECPSRDMYVIVPVCARGCLRCKRPYRV